MLQCQFLEMRQKWDLVLAGAPGLRLTMKLQFCLYNLYNNVIIGGLSFSFRWYLLSRLVNVSCCAHTAYRPAAYPCRIHKPVLGTRYSGTVPCHMISLYITCSYIIIDDAIYSALLMTYSAILNVWDTDYHLVHENSQG